MAFLVMLSNLCRRERLLDFYHKQLRSARGFLLIKTHL